jgi:MFS family permease
MTAAPTQSLSAELRSLPRAYWVLTIGWFINRFGTFVHPLLTILLSRAGHVPSHVAWVLCANGLGNFSAGLLGGYFSDRFGRRHALVLGTMGNAAAIVALYFAITFTHSILLIAGLMFAAGFGGGFYMPASSALLADLVPPPLRVRAYSAQRLAINAGFACGASTAAFLAIWAVFIGDALTTALFGLIALLYLPHGLKASREEATWAEAWRVLRSDRAFWALAAATLLSSFLFQQFNSTFSLEVLRRKLELNILGLHFSSPQVFGLILGWNGLMVVLFELPFTRWTQRFPSRRVIVIGYFLLGAGLAVNAVGTSVWPMFIGMTIFTFGEMLSQPVRSAYIAELAPLAMRGRYMGAVAMAGTFANVFGPHVSLPLHAWSPQTLWLGCGGIGLLAAVVLGFFGSERKGQGETEVAPGK